MEENKIVAENNLNPKKEGKFTPYQVKLSCIFMGVGQLFCKQFTKGILLILLEIAFILFLIFSGINNIIGIFTLGTDEGIPIMGIQGDNSVKMLAWGITTLFLCVFFGLAYYANIKDVIFTTQEIKKGHHIKTFFESCSTLINGKFYFLTLTIPLLFVCVFNIMPIIFTGLVAFTNYGDTIVPPKLVDWIGFSNFRLIFTVSEYATTILKILGWNFIWAIGSTFINYFGGLGLAILYNSKCLKWKRVWRIFPMLAYAIPGFITLTGFRFLFSDSGPILALLRDWGWVSENFTFIGFDAKWSLRLLGFFSCAWISIPSIMFLATGILSNVNQEMYEAARLDGANAWKQFLYLTLPFVLFATTPVLLNSFISNFNNFSIFYFLRSEITYDMENYTMSRYRFKSRKQMMKATLLLNIFPNFMNMTALFVIMTQFDLVNNLWGLILLYSSGATMGFLVQKGFFDTIPSTIYDAATLDGATDLRVFASITLPLSKPMIVYTALTAFVWPWSDFMLPKLLLPDKSQWTVAIGLNWLDESKFSIFAAGSVFIAVPIVALYIALSKYLIQGGAAGAVKE